MVQSSPDFLRHAWFTTADERAPHPTESNPYVAPAGKINENLGQLRKTG